MLSLNCFIVSQKASGHMTATLAEHDKMIETSLSKIKDDNFHHESCPALVFLPFV